MAVTIHPPSPAPPGPQWFGMHVVLKAAGARYDAHVHILAGGQRYSVEGSPFRTGRPADRPYLEEVEITHCVAERLKAHVFELLDAMHAAQGSTRAMLGTLSLSGALRLPDVDALADEIAAITAPTAPARHGIPF